MGIWGAGGKGRVAPNGLQTAVWVWGAAAGVVARAAAMLNSVNVIATKATIMAKVLITMVGR